MRRSKSKRDATDKRHYSEEDDKKKFTGGELTECGKEEEEEKGDLRRKGTEAT